MFDSQCLLLRDFRALECLSRLLPYSDTGPEKTFFKGTYDNSSPYQRAHCLLYTLEQSTQCTFYGASFVLPYDGRMASSGSPPKFSEQFFLLSHRPELLRTNWNQI